MSLTLPTTRRHFLQSVSSGLAALACPTASAFANNASFSMIKDADVDLKLGLLIDFSPSVSVSEHGINEVALQVEGTAAAFEDTLVVSCIEQQPRGVAVNLVHFAGNQKEVIEWRTLNTSKDCFQFASDIRDIGTNHGILDPGTHISEALDFMNASMQKSSLSALRNVVDISGDGPDNLMGLRDSLDNFVRNNTAKEGRDFLTDPESIGLMRVAVEKLAMNKITVNGISICNEVPELDLYYRFCVATPADTYFVEAKDGRKESVPGGFVVKVESPQSYRDALADKLVLEIIGLGPLYYPAHIRPAFV